MTPDRFRAALEELHWSLRAVAEMLEGDERNARRWASGKLTIPEAVAQWIEERLELHRRHPPPTNWRRRQSAPAEEATAG